ncbi:hypothetical protein CRE_03787 [Caenorhabditis remanei]|uniref:Protein kinase domain-containing protein n=1 Tax=Caenorhabditis remanei TaxID=31234 RepID=E3LYA5_CAERE|nr:hypothetical protein CRE_03787 [Caenorhabditis remanei]
MSKQILLCDGWKMEDKVINKYRDYNEYTAKKDENEAVVYRRIEGFEEKPLDFEGISSDVSGHVNVAERINKPVDANQKYKDPYEKKYIICESYPKSNESWYKNDLDEKRIKGLMKQLFAGLEYIHSKKVVHRDIQPENLKLFANDILKIYNFTSACYSNREANDLLRDRHRGTVQYRPIELLFCKAEITTAVDMWSAGCVLAELFMKRPLFDGVSQPEVICKIFGYLGKPTTEVWNEIIKDTITRDRFDLDGVVEQGSGFEEELEKNKVPANAIDLIKNLIVYRPEHRLTAAQALKHAYFKED